MTPEEITATLTKLFNIEEVKEVAPGSWQVDSSNFRLLVLLSEDSTWLRLFLPIVPLQEAEPFLVQLLAANFDETQEVRYAIYDDVVWGVYHHNNSTLVSTDLASAIAKLISLHQAGLDSVFNQFAENRIRQIIQAAKQQGQSLETTMQNLDRFYAEGLLGEVDQSSEIREQVLATWRYQLERLWDEVK